MGYSENNYVAVDEAPASIALPQFSALSVYFW